MPRFGFVGGEAAHKFLQFGNLFFGAGVGGLLAGARNGRGFHVVVVIAGVEGEGAVIKVCHVGADLVEKVAVVADDDHGAVAFVEHVFEPADGVDVEVVGRFIEQQDVRIGEQRLRQQYAQFPARGDFAHQPLVQRGFNAYAEQQFTGARFGGVAVVFGKAAFQFGGVQVVFFAGFGVGVDGVLFLHTRPHFFVPHHDDIQHAAVFVGELVLTQIGHAFGGFVRDVAGGGFQHAAQDFHEGGFARAIGTNQAIAQTVAKLDADVFKQGLCPELHGDVGGNQHGAFSP